MIYCTKCGEELSRTPHTIEKLLHTPGDAKRENEVDSDCTQEGSYELVVYCTECKDELSREEKVIPLKPHNYIDGYCDECGEQRVSLNLLYEETEGGYAVIGMGECTDTDLVIPTTYNDLPVVAIGANAFENQTNLKSIYIPAHVVRMGVNAFAGCPNVEKIVFAATAMEDMDYTVHPFTDIGAESAGIALTVAKNVTQIPDYLFHSTSYGSTDLNITSITFEEGSVCERIGGNTFKYARKLVSLDLPDSLRHIGTYAFFDCKGLKNVRVPSGLLTVGYLAFEQCYDLQGTVHDNAYYLGNEENLYVLLWKMKDSSITSCEIHEDCALILDHAFRESALTGIVIPDSVRFIGDYAFWQCKSLAALSIGSGISEIGPNVFDSCTGLASLIIPDTVISIGHDAFYKCTGLQSISFGTGLTDIGARAFAECSKLASVTIPEGILTIGAQAFYACRDLTAVYFNATAMNDVLKEESSIFQKSGTTTGDIRVVIGKNVTKIPAYLFYCDTSYARWSSVVAEIEFASDGVLTSIGAAAFSGSNKITSLSLPASVTTVGASAFSNIGITELVIPATVKTLESNAFANCYSLKELTVSDGVTTLGYGVFSGCSALLSATVGSDVTSIGASAFSSCKALASITLKCKGASFGREAFKYCTALAGVYVPDMDTFCSLSFEEQTANPLYFAKKLYLTGSGEPQLVTDLVIPDSVTVIGGYAFYGSSFENISIGKGVTTIGKYAFANCQALKTLYFNAAAMADLQDRNYIFYDTDVSGDGFEVIIGKDVTHIPAYLFRPNYDYNAPKITSVVFEEGTVCESSGMYAFGVCKEITGVYIYDINTFVAMNLDSNPLSVSNKLYLMVDGEPTLVTDIVLSDSVTRIGDKIFNGYTELKSIVLGNGVTSIGVYAFSKCTALTEIIIPDSVTVIYGSAFEGCINLAKVTLGKQLEIINSRAFRECKSLTSIEIPDSVKTIGSTCFEYCESLTEVTIGEGVTAIQTYAFRWCDALTSATFKVKEGWTVTKGNKTYDIKSSYLENLSTAAGYLKDSYAYYSWKRA